MGVIALVVAVAALHAAAPGKDPCADARSAYESLSLERAVEIADAALQKNPQLLKCLEVKALALLVLGQGDTAKSALQELFTQSPDYKIDDPSLSPALHDTITQIREAVRPIQARVTVRWLIREEMRIDFVLEGGIRDATKIRYSVETDPTVERHSGEVTLLGRVGTATVAAGTKSEIQKARVSGSVLNDDNKLVTRFEKEVLVTDRPPAPSPDVADNGITWPIWVGIGLAVVGGAVAIAIFAQPRLPDTAGTSGRVGLP
jgi:hypothetical protein